MSVNDAIDKVGSEKWVLGGIVAVALLLVASVATGGLTLAYLLPTLALVGMWALLALGLNVQWGYAGLINFSVAAFWGIGMYSVALFTAPGSPLGINQGFFVAVAVAVVASTVLALLIGIPTLRLRTDYLAIASLGLAEVVRLVILNEREITAGSQGISIDALFPSLVTFLDSIFAPDAPAFPYRGLVDLLLVSVGILLVYAFLRRVHRSPWGRVMRTIRSDEDLAEALGKNTYWYKMQAFVIGSILMALAGVFYAYQFRYVAPGDLEPISTFYVWVAVILGGTGSNRGAVLGAVTIVLIREGTRFLGGVGFGLDAAALRLLFVGLLIIAVVRFRSEGLLPPKRELIWPAAREDDS
ncbi:branched-chain amino acid transport system permease protein [Halogranum gelatinilyticum]|uniref:Branched-chain amino acid transport system permease protein n=1 Tax=Halogranum gelatinilyticum TaxID=660521 RepID=A0A1G9VF58_9EURY|nr:branched-chain amino acid ABC transporter permease [Halogranum gelatinilyticum]SDM70759.1 branched-chain amino acid transport system permease protein [Halogranum gelatinilyticum]